MCCADCKANYVRQTKRSFEDRIKEHDSYINTESVISLNMSSYNHKSQWDKTTILDIARNYKKRLISQLLPINTLNNMLNKIKDTHKLNNMNSLIKLN